MPGVRGRSRSNAVPVGLTQNLKLTHYRFATCSIRERMRVEHSADHRATGSGYAGRLLRIVSFDLPNIRVGHPGGRACHGDAGAVGAEGDCARRVFAESLDLFAGGQVPYPDGLAAPIADRVSGDQGIRRVKGPSSFPTFIPFAVRSRR